MSGLPPFPSRWLCLEIGDHISSAGSKPHFLYENSSNVWYLVISFCIGASILWTKPTEISWAVAAWPCGLKNPIRCSSCARQRTTTSVSWRWAISMGKPTICLTCWSGWIRHEKNEDFDMLIGMKKNKEEHTVTDSQRNFYSICTWSPGKRGCQAEGGGRSVGGSPQCRTNWGFSTNWGILTTKQPGSLRNFPSNNLGFVL